MKNAVLITLVCLALALDILGIALDEVCLSVAGAGLAIACIVTARKWKR